MNGETGQKRKRTSHISPKISYQTHADGVCMCVCINKMNLLESNLQTYIIIMGTEILRGIYNFIVPSYKITSGKCLP